MDIVVIPDVHVTPEKGNHRLYNAGRYCIRNKPDYIVCLGDFAEMRSLSYYDNNKLSGEGFRYKDDVESCKKALAKFEEPFIVENEYLRRSKKKLYRPEKFMCLGNHEDRITKAANDNPRLYGTLSIMDLGFEEQGWIVVPYMRSVIIEGVAFSHCFSSGVMGKPIATKNTSTALLEKQHMSCVAGHSHKFEMYTDINARGQMMIGVVAGCYFYHQMTWTNENHRYFRGLIHLKNVKDGSFHLSQVPMEEVDL